MDRQTPNFNIFFKPTSFTKPNISNNKSSNKPLFQSKTQSHNRLHQLPQTQFPTSQNPVPFYKIKQRLTSQMFTNRIGYRIRQFNRIQQDYICYLTQLLMTQCNWIKVFIIEPNYLYFQMNSISTQEQSVNSNQQQQIQLQNRIFNFLKYINENIFNPWVQVNLSGNYLTSNQFNQDSFLQSFTKSVIQIVNNKYIQLFTINKHKKQGKK